jgi:hypothetical protein
MRSYIKMYVTATISLQPQLPEEAGVERIYSVLEAMSRTSEGVYLALGKDALLLEQLKFSSAWTKYPQRIGPFKR